MGVLAQESSGLNLSFQGLKSVVVGYGPNEGNVGERDRFWNDMDRTLDSLGNVYRLCILEDLNVCLVDRMRASITGDFGVP